MGIEITSSLSLKSSVHVWTSTPSITHPPGIEAVCWAIVYTDEEMDGFFPEDQIKRGGKKEEEQKSSIKLLVLAHSSALSHRTPLETNNKTPKKLYR